MELTERILKGDRRAVARAITLIENDATEKDELLQELHKHTGNAYLIGITGPPGAGKSTLTDQLLFLLRKQGLKIGVIAVDPTSPFTGGAILGDRVRMNDHALDPGVFIRSMGTRGSLGGLAKATKEATRVLDAYGIDVILIETVGVGQSELDIMNVADTTTVVLNPSAGDHIQTMKAGIMEIADLFVINKADLPGADKTEREINNMLDFIHDFDWRPPVLKTTVSQPASFQAMWEACCQHRTFLQENGLWEKRRKQRRQDEIVGIIEDRVQSRIRHWIEKNPSWQQILTEVEAGEKNPYQVADLILEWYNTSNCD
ncbi:methylmalonyl Co-A mutase-associated GTPase MeaB [Effusibacillus dendaii]|uniref:Methylmalonyl Co-A mutase-associated GTPase MeaB n=1 Tax=Effusibacillus dendaii TaxID=2743772 RepID=A0A7I8DGC7_9BACL|nr:methylmalonyl Co-A mutase-associated GTPase MeaB [Effusibacillus dendaii]BCJ87640.1 methylmalonyl Co-A mutase-associated GTPase MeaB [Effusibacillus dendaii]